jgi:hypothetical protein
MSLTAFSSSLNMVTEESVARWSFKVGEEGGVKKV